MFDFMNIFMFIHVKMLKFFFFVFALILFILKLNFMEILIKMLIFGVLLYYAVYHIVFNADGWPQILSLFF